MTPRVSVVVPVYNVAPWLDRCVASLAGQSFADIEILLVDDGSTDGSGRICDQWATRDPRVRAIHTANAGVSAARNRGLREATGKFLAFVDSDDWVDPELIATLVDGMAGEVDWAACCLGRVDAAGTVGQAFTLGVSGGFDCARLSEDFLEKTLTSFWLFQPVCKLYRLDLIRDHGMSFDTDMSFGEDFAFNLAYLRHARRVQMIDRVLYFYRILPGGLSSSFNERKAVSFCRAKDLLLGFVRERGLFVNRVRVLVVQNILNEYFSLMTQLVRSRSVPRRQRLRYFAIMRSCAALQACLPLVGITDLTRPTRLALAVNTYLGWEAYWLLHRVFRGR